jgi:protein disulfide-isomerase A6
VSYINDKCNKDRNADGSLAAQAGRLPAFDDLVAKLASTTDKSSLVAQAKQLATGLSGLDERLAKLYIRVFEKIAANENDFADKEADRIRRMLESGSVKPAKADEFQMRINVLSAFSSE